MAKKKKKNSNLRAIPKEIKMTIPSVEIVYFLQNLIDPKDTLQYYIVSDPKDEDAAKGIYHYKSDLFKELLIQYDNTRSDMAIKHKGKRYITIKRFYANKKGVPEYILPKHIVIREDAGYYSNELPNFCRNIEVLLYSRYTENYEVARVTYNEKADMCYMDLRLLSKFLKKYDWPKISMHYALDNKWETKSYWDAFFDDEEGTYLFNKRIRPKSILKQFGYGVSQEGGLTKAERQELLGEIMDLLILSKEEVLQILESAKRMHRGIKYAEAQGKWNADIKFVKNYEVDRNRFLPHKVESSI